MSDSKRGMNRRAFLGRAGGVVALGGGLYAAAGAREASAAMDATETTWTGFWRPHTPSRLSAETHDLAARALAGEHGRGLVSINDRFGMKDAPLTSNARYAEACRLVAEHAPVRIEPGERVVGSASLIEAPMHQVPVMGIPSVSHTTLGWDKALRIGYKGLREEIAQRRRRGGLDDKGGELLDAMEACLDAAAVWHKRYMDELGARIAAAEGLERRHYEGVRANLERVPENPPETFREAVQSLWFMYAFQRLMGNWPGIGRIDEMLGGYLEADLAAGRITLDEAREVLAHFWIRGCEWIGAFDGQGSGDAQHYQNIVLSGVDSEGRDVTNAVTYLVLDVVEELRISDFPIAVRLNSRTPDKLLRRMAEVQRHGGGIVAAYNEDVALEGLVRFGYDIREARDYANDGCWEIIIPGKTMFSYVPFDALVLLNDVLGVLAGGDAPAPEFAEFDSLFQAYEDRLRLHVEAIQNSAEAWSANGHAAPLVSLLVEGCVEKGRGYYDRGPKYTVMAPHAGRLANVANSLVAIKKLVYEDRYLTLAEYVELLRKDWEGQEPLRRLVLNRFAFYGNDDDEADAMMERVFDAYTGIVGETKERSGVLMPCGISTFGREIEWSLDANAGKATADGHKAGAVLATNFSPSPSTDKKGPTAVLKSYCKMDFTRTPNCATVELKVHPDSVKGGKGVEDLVALHKAFLGLGGMFMHVDVVDSAMLIDAQRHPEKYPNLQVRIAGWSARFATLNKHWQDMVIARTQQVV